MSVKADDKTIRLSVLGYYADLLEKIARPIGNYGNDLRKPREMYN